MSSSSVSGQTSARAAFARHSAGDPAGGPLTVVLATVSSDAHTWNLLYLRLLIEEKGHQVVGLGPCTPPELVVRTCQRVRPDLLVVSTVNGHGHRDGHALIERLRGTDGIAGIPAVIGGKLDISGSTSGCRQLLLDAGYQAVFDDADGGAAVGTFLDGVFAGLRRAAVRAPTP